MDKFPDLEQDTLLLRIKVQGDGELEIAYGHSLSDDMDEDEALYLIDVLNGINVSLTTSLDHFALVGKLLREIHDKEDEDELCFEPDEDLLKAVSDAKIVPFNKNRLN